MLTVIFLAGGTTAAVAYEEPEYETLATTEHYDVRRYAPYIIAEVDVAGDLRQSGNNAFRILAGYISGDNRPRRKMNMTVPVESVRTGVRMNMTAPVVSGRPASESGGYTYAFIMEREYSLETLPQPTDDRIRIREKPARTVAAKRFSGRVSEQKYAQAERELLEALSADGVTVLGEPVLARYDGPFTPGFLRRNEILVEIVAP